MPVKLSEADVTSQIRGFLECRGWRIIRFQRTVISGQFSTHEPGTPDLMAILYGSICSVIWIEVKRKGAVAKCRCATKKPRQRCTACDQKNWKDREISKGAIVWTIDSLESIESHYCASGLNRGRV